MALLLTCTWQRCAGKFFWYTLFMLLTLTFFTQYGMCAVSFTPNNQMAAVVSSAAYGVW